jgi:hypothetical protein
VYVAVSASAAILDADEQIADLRSSYTSFVDQGAAAKLQKPSSPPASRGALIASGKEAAISLIQHNIQHSVEAPARLESLHILDAPDEQGLTVVRASVRIRGLAPERVAAFVRHLESTVPAILFDDLRIAIHTRPGLFGAAGTPAAQETDSADISGVVRIYARGAADRPAPGMAGPQP